MKDPIHESLAGGLQNAPDAVGLISNAGLLRYCNNSLQHILGLRSQACLGISLVAHLPTSSQAEARQALAELSRGSSSAEWTTHPGEGVDERALLWRASRLDEGSQALVIARPLQARGDVFYRALAEQMPDSLWVLDAEERPGHILYANSAATRAVGYSYEEVLGMSIVDLNASKTTHRFGERLERLLAGETLVFVSHHRRRDGSVLPVEVTAQLIHDGTRRVILAIEHDVSERRGAEAERKKRKQYDLLLQHIAVAANEAEDVDEALTTCLQEVCRMVGWPLGHAYRLQERRSELVTSGHWYVDGDDGTFAEFRRLSETLRFTPGVGLPGRVLLEKKALWSTDLATDPHFVRASALEKAGLKAGFAFPVWVHRRIVAVLEFFSPRPAAPDAELLQVMTPVAAQLGRVLERQEAEAARLAMEAKVLEAQKHESLGVLAGGIAHDFNNLLVGILGNASLALSGLPDDHPSRLFLQRVDQAAERASDLANQMLAYSGRGRFVIRPFDVAELVAEMADLLRSSIPKKTRLDLSLRAGLPKVEGDATQIRQLVLNLITNASQAIGGDEGRIVVGVEQRQVGGEAATEGFEPEPKDGSYLVIEVKDDGSGMDSATLQRIFEPFFTTKETGRGLGLAATLGIVRSHGGSIRVRSRPGEGTCFEILLPRCDPPDSPDLRSAAGEAPTSCKLKAGTVLVVDDEETVRSLAASVLGQQGFDVLSAADGREALETLARERGHIDAVVLDMSMPHLDGLQVLRQIRQTGDAVKVVLSSGYSEDAVRQQWVGVDGVGFLQKPYRPAALLSAVRRALG